MSKAYPTRETWRPRKKKRKRQPDGSWWAPGRVYAAPVGTPTDSPLWEDIGALNGPLDYHMKAGVSYELHYSGSIYGDPPFGVSGGPYPKRDVVFEPPKTGKTQLHGYNYAVQGQNHPPPTVATPEED
jgi:hypothetical protein